MYPSKAIFTQSKAIRTDHAGDLIERCFKEVYSPKQTLEELIAELESSIQSKINSNPGQYLHDVNLNGIQARKILLKIEEIDNNNLNSIIQSEGRCLGFNATVEYEEVYLLGYFNNNFIVANTGFDLWQDYVDVIYIPDEDGLSLKKVQLIE